jgi:hypothetical protein
MTFEELRDSPEGPILVVITEDSWKGFSLHTEYDARDLELVAFLTEMGGVDKSVTPGKYYFNSVNMGPDTNAISLEPVPEDHEIYISIEPIPED